MNRAHMVGALLVAFGGAFACIQDEAATPRDLYEVHLGPAKPEVIHGLLDACLADAALEVRALSAKQPSGVDLRVELSVFATQEAAACVDAYLADAGAVALGTETDAWQDSETFTGTTGTASTSSTSGP